MITICQFSLRYFFNVGVFHFLNLMIIQLAQMSKNTYQNTQRISLDIFSQYMKMFVYVANLEEYISEIFEICSFPVNKRASNREAYGIHFLSFLSVTSYK